MSDSVTSHREQARADDSTRVVGCAILTISDTRVEETDTSGRAIERRLVEAGHRIVDRRIVPDDAGAIAGTLDAWLRAAAVGLILTTGGTGIGRRDTTIEVVRARLSREIEGFGELFRAISFGEIGSAAMLSRAVGGLVARDASAGGDTFLFAMPGSTNAVETAMTRLILPELAHLVWQRKE